MLLDDFLKDFDEDDNRWWSMDSGDHLNLLQQALNKIVDLEREVEAWKFDAKEAHETVAAIDEDRIALEQRVSRLTEAIEKHKLVCGNEYMTSGDFNKADCDLWSVLAPPAAQPSHRTIVPG